MQFGDYELLERIAVGGMAEVYRARRLDDRSAKPVGIKRILPHLCADEKFIEMFVKEAQLTASLRHECIAQVFDFGVLDGTFFLAMELVDGHDLRWVLEQLEERREVMPVPLAVHIVLSVCEALAHAHAARDEEGLDLGVVHRDVSPPNILLSHAGDVKLIDFGIAKARMYANQTTHGRIKGKCAYMAPEQIRSQAVDARADLFGVGAVLHELLTGKALFLGPSQIATLQLALQGPITAPSEIRPEIPPELDAITLKALARDLGARYQRAEQIIADLRRFSAASGYTASAAALAGWLSQLPEPRQPERDPWVDEASGITSKHQSIRRLRGAIERKPTAALYSRAAIDDAPSAPSARSVARISRVARLVERGAARGPRDAPRRKNLHALAAASAALPLPPDELEFTPPPEPPAPARGDRPATATQEGRRDAGAAPSGETTTVRTGHAIRVAYDPRDAVGSYHDDVPTVNARPDQLAALVPPGEGAAEDQDVADAIDDGPTTVDSCPAGAMMLDDEDESPRTLRAPSTAETPALPDQGLLDEPTIDAPSLDARGIAEVPEREPAQPQHPAIVARSSQATERVAPVDAPAAAALPPTDPAERAVATRRGATWRWIGLAIIVAMLAASALGVFLLSRRSQPKQAPRPPASELLLRTPPRA